MVFESVIQGIPCQIKVLHFHPAQPMRVYGPEFYDADPPEDAELEYEVLDRKGYKANWLEAKITNEDEINIFEKYKELTTNG